MLELAREPSLSTGDYLAEVLEEFCATADPEECARALELIDHVAAELNDRESPAVAVGPQPADATSEVATPGIASAVVLPERAPMPAEPVPAPTRKPSEPPLGPRPQPPPPYRDDPDDDDPLARFERECS